MSTTKLSKEDIRNGWTQASLDNYLKEREEQKLAFMLQEEKRKPVQVENVSSYNPQNWRA